MRLVRISLLTVLLSGLLLGDNADPVIGRWKLNWETSQSEGAAPKSAIRTYAQFRDGFRVSEVWRGQDGKGKFIYTWIMRTPVMLFALTEGAQLIRY
jgi:hypothetical protein